MTEWLKFDKALLPQSQTSCVQLPRRRSTRSKQIVSDFLSAFPLRGRWAADCAARMRWQIFISLYNNIKPELFHLITVLRRSFPSRGSLGQFPLTFSCRHTMSTRYNASLQMLFDNIEEVICSVFKALSGIIDIDCVVRLLERCNFSVAVLIVAFFDVL